MASSRKKAADSSQDLRTNSAKLSTQWVGCFSLPRNLLSTEIDYTSTIKYIEDNYDPGNNSSAARPTRSQGVPAMLTGKGRATLQPDGDLLDSNNMDLVRAIHEKLAEDKRILIPYTFEFSAQGNSCPAAILTQVANVPDGYGPDHLRWQVVTHTVKEQHSLCTLYKSKIAELPWNLDEYLKKMCLSETPWDDFMVMLTAVFFDVSTNY